jgi:hypothetical protein
VTSARAGATFARAGQRDAESAAGLPLMTRLRARLCTSAAVVCLVSLLPWSPAAGTAPLPDDPAPALTASGDYHYTLAGRIRLLLFWVGRHEVGVGRFARHELENGRTVELMVGMEPEKAPRRANRWGYTREDLRGSETTVIVAGTDYEADSLDDIQKRLEREVSIAVGVLRARITPDAAVVRTTALETDHQTTYRDIETILERATDQDHSWRTRRIDRPEGVRPGFLLALAEWIDRSVAAHRRGQTPAASQGGGIPYVYSARIYDMTLRRLTFEPEARFRGRTYPNVLNGEFEARNRETGERNRFSVSFGTEADLTGVPVRILLKPRWWLEAELLLDR